MFLCMKYSMMGWWKIRLGDYQILLQLDQIQTKPCSQSIKVFYLCLIIILLHRPYTLQHSSIIHVTVWFYSFPPPLSSPSAYMDTAAVTGLAVGLGLVCVVVAVLIAVIFYMRRRMNNTNVVISEPSHGIIVVTFFYKQFMDDINFLHAIAAFHVSML